jgi:hypothetical protein
MPTRKDAFLRGLSKDKSGNTLAIMAAAFIPLAGLIGGGVDMTRIYITKTRLQQACDAGALSGRKAMGSGSWTTNGATSSRGHAYQLFAANFKDGDYGTSGLTREFTESEGTVTGVASADVPMTLMQLFDEGDHEVSVVCTAEMEIPNTDVMFVLDVTLSMECAPSDANLACNTGVAASSKRITGLRKAVKCFYEALLKVNTAEVCGGDPTATAYTGTAQVRLGFVPYATNVNLGKLLPNTFIANNWTYPSREANTTTVQTWVVGAQSSTSWGNWSSPPTLNQASGYSNFADVSTSGGATTTINGTARTKRPKNGSGGELTSAQCLALNIMVGSGQTMLDITDASSLQTATQVGTPAAPVHPATVQTINYNQEDDHAVRGYRYRYNNVTTDDCRLQRSDERTYTLDRDGTATKPVTWTPYQQWSSWTYKARTIDVSALKNGGSTWNSTVSVPNASTTSISGLRLSGANASSTTSITVPAAESVTWGGCVLDRATWQNSDGDPSDEWDPIPDEATDLDINLVPTGTSNQWGPLIQNAYYGRESGGSRTTSNVTTTTLSPSWERGDYYCPNASRKLKEYTSASDTTDFEGYINGLLAEGRGTYHDVGMLWGARFLSPTGIFADENDFTADGGAIERHLIFMTDGSTQTQLDNLYSFGLPWWDRRQTSQEPTATLLDSLVNERIEAMCTAIKNMNIKLWVISYGAGVNTTNKTRLQNCASPGQFYDAADTNTLIANFKQIASEIADLRLTE